MNNQPTVKISVASGRNNFFVYKVFNEIGGIKKGRACHQPAPIRKTLRQRV